MCERCAIRCGSLRTLRDGSRDATRPSWSSFHGSTTCFASRSTRWRHRETGDMPAPDRSWRTGWDWLAGVTAAAPHPAGRSVPVKSYILFYLVRLTFHARSMKFLCSLSVQGTYFGSYLVSCDIIAGSLYLIPPHVTRQSPHLICAPLPPHLVVSTASCEPQGSWRRSRCKRVPGMRTHRR